MKHTPGPWVWTAASAGPLDEYTCQTRGPIDLRVFKSPGYYDNPELYAGEVCILSAGSGEYNPLHGCDQRGRLVAQ